MTDLEKLLLITNAGAVAVAFCAHNVGWHRAMAKCCGDVGKMLGAVSESPECTPGDDFDMFRVAQAIFRELDKLRAGWDP